MWLMATMLDITALGHNYHSLYNEIASSYTSDANNVFSTAAIAGLLQKKITQKKRGSW